MHAPSRSSYDPGEKLTVTGLSSVPLCAGGLLREKVNHRQNELLNEEPSCPFRAALEQMCAQLSPDFRFPKCGQINDESDLCPCLTFKIKENNRLQ